MCKPCVNEVQNMCKNGQKCKISAKLVYNVSKKCVNQVYTCKSRVNIVQVFPILIPNFWPKV